MTRRLAVIGDPTSQNELAEVRDNRLVVRPTTTIAEEGAPLVVTLSQNGAGSTFQATGNYSGGAVNWDYRPAAGVKARIVRLIVSVQDAGTFDAADYGNGIALSNGIKIRVVTDVTGAATTQYHLVDTNPILANADWSRYAYDTQVQTWGTGDEFLSAQWTFAKFTQAGLYLDGDTGDAFRVVLNDDFTGLTGHRFTLEGYAGADIT